MKKKCMAVGGTAKKPATMEEQLAGIRGKVRPGYQAGGPIYRSGNAFSDQQIGEPMKGISGSGMSGQVDSMLDRTKAMPGSIASSPQYSGSVIPAQTGQQAMQAAANFGMPPAGVAPSPTSQTISTGDYSTGPRQGGFVDEYGKPRPADSTPTAPPAPPSPLMTMAEKEAAIGLNPNRIYKPGSAADPMASGGGIAQALKAVEPMAPAQDRTQSPVQQGQVGARRRIQRPEFAEGGIIDKLIRTVGKILPDSSGERYEPGIQSRAAEDPMRPFRAEALNPRTQTDSAENPPRGGFQEEAERRRKQMKEAMNYGSGGMVRFSGKGGPRDDQIPVKVAGEEINVSNGENAVILPAKTAANPAALYAIGGIIQATNDGRKPKMGMDKGGKYASGSMPNDEWMPEGGYLRTPEGRQRVAEAIVNAPSIGGNVSFGGQQPATAQSIYAPAIDALKKGLSGEGMRPDVGIIGPRAAPVAQEQSPIVARNIEVMNSGAGAGRIDLPITPAQKQAAIANTAAARQAQGITAGVAQPSGAAVNDGMTTTQMGRGFDPTKLQMADGYGMATNAAGKTIAAGNAEYVGADGKPTSRWTDTQQYNDAIARNEADKLRLAEMQARRLGADPMAVQRASQGIAQAVQQSGLAAQQAGQAQQVQQFAIDRAAREQSLIDAWDKAGTPEQKQAIAGQLKIMRGQQDKEGQFKDAVEEVVDEKTGQVIKRPVIYNASTGQPVQQGQAQAQQSFKTADEVEAARKAGKVKSGDVVIINGRPARIN